MRGIVTLALVAAFTVALLAAISYPYSGKSITSEPYELKRFTSYEELKNFLSKAQASIKGPYEIMVDNLIGTTPTIAQSLKPRFSETNIQVAGVDEEDIVKTDGEYIYLARDNQIFIVRAYPAEEASLLSTVNATGPVTGLYVSGDRLIAVAGGWSYYPIPECVNCVTVGKPFIAANTSIQVFDISDRRNPIEARRATLSGWPVTSRMIGDYVYLITSEPVVIQDGGDIVLPSYSDGQHIHNVRPVEIYYTDIPDYGYTYTNVMALNILREDEAPTITTIMAPASGIVYVSRENIYIASLHWSDTGETVIHRLAVDEARITPAAVGAVPGHLLNQFSLDEYDGYLRVATTLSSSMGESVNSIYILDMGLELVGKVEGLAPGETIYSARFMGDKAYLVTFRKVDPLFVVDLKPTEPRVLGKLKIPGYSSYLHPYGDKYLIGIGKDAKPAESGDFAWFQGLKLSLFDVSDFTNPREVDSLILGDRGTESEVLYNHRAFLFDEERAILVIPVLLALIDPTDFGGSPPQEAYGEYVFQGVYVFRVTPSDGVEIIGRITHQPDDTDLLKSGEFFASRYMVKRSLFIGDILYTISDGGILLNDILTLEMLSEISLPL